MHQTLTSNLDLEKDELRAHNYICHFTVFKKSLLDQIGQAYRPEFDGSQDHDMVLRLTEKAEKIVHIPKVLYYWRVHPQSVSMNLDSKVTQLMRQYMQSANS